MSEQAKEILRLLQEKYLKGVFDGSSEFNLRMDLYGLIESKQERAQIIQFVEYLLNIEGTRNVINDGRFWSDTTDADNHDGTLIISMLDILFDYSEYGKQNNFDSWYFVLLEVCLVDFFKRIGAFEPGRVHVHDVLSFIAAKWISRKPLEYKNRCCEFIKEKSARYFNFDGQVLTLYK